MPDIFRGAQFILSDDKVQIPDVNWDEILPQDASEEQNDEIRPFIPEQFGSVEDAEKAYIDSAETVEPEQTVEQYAPVEEPQTVFDEEIVTAQEPQIVEPEPEPISEEEIEEMIRFTPEELEEIYRPEIEALKSDAANKAYYDALRKKKADIDKCIKNVNEQLDLMVGMQVDYFEKYERELKYLAIEIAQKMIISRIEEDDLTLNRLVMQTVNASKGSAWLKVEISEHLVGLVDTLKEELKNADDYCRMEVVPTASPDDTVRVSGEQGTVDASISTQAENLRVAFESAEEEDE